MNQTGDIEDTRILADSQHQVIFLQGGTRAYSFRKNITKGQYVLPFSFKLPNDIPGTFNM